MKVTIKVNGTTFTVECEKAINCEQLKELVSDLYDRSLDNYKLYRESDRTRLSDSDEVDGNILAIKAKNESANN